MLTQTYTQHKNNYFNALKNTQLLAKLFFIFKKKSDSFQINV